MTSKEIRNSFLKFFEERGHKIVPSASVIPYDDPTLLFTNAGMNQFKDVFLGTGKRDYTRAANSQKCIRVSGKHNDLEEVGRDTYHHTFFEMLGNWSFGDYYKKEAIEWAWELLTKIWGLDKKRLYATVFESDDESEQLWKKVTDIDSSHVIRFGKKDNFWEMGETGPCGPCSEIHVDLTDDLSGRKFVNAGDARVMEIWNLVFIQYNRDDKGTLTPLPSKHVDTGMGFERICAVLQGKKSNYDTDVFMPIINRISEIAGQPYKAQLNDPLDIAMRVVADHARMLSFSIADGGIPSNEGRGYVIRRILRRGARFGRTLGLYEPFLYEVVSSVVESMGEQYPEIKAKQNHIERVIKGEEESFNQTLDRGLEIFEGVIEEIGHSKTFPGEDAFKLYDTFGFPLDLTEMMAKERGLTVDSGRFVELMEEQRKRGRKKTIHKFLDKIILRKDDRAEIPHEIISGKLYIQRSNWAEAEKWLLRGINRDKTNYEAYWLLGNVMMQQEKFKASVEAFDNSLSLNDKFKEKIEEAKKYIWATTLNKGVKLYNQSISASPDSSKMLIEKAIESYGLALEVNPDSAITYQNLAAAYHTQGNFDEEINTLKQALTRKQTVAVHTLLINAYLQKAQAAEEKNDKQSASENYNNALTAILEARKTAPEDVELLAAMIDIHVRLGKANDAKPYIREAIEKDPTNKVYQYDLGVLLMQTDSLDEAITHFENALKVDPKYEVALQNIGVAYMRVGDNLKRAAQNTDVKKIVDKSYIENFKKASEYFKRLADLKPNDVNAFDLLASAYANSNRVKEAKGALNKADVLRRKPSKQEKQEIIDEIPVTKPIISLDIEDWFGDGKFSQTGKSDFLGYENRIHEGIIKLFRPSYDGFEIILDKTPFYVESGGQISDEGVIKFPEGDFPVINLYKIDNFIVHRVKGDILKSLNKNLIVLAKVDEKRRINIERNHTATHLLHEALRMTLGEHLHQQGSLVAPDRLRFDFNHFEKITPDQIRKIEDIVNEKIVADLPVIAESDPNKWITIEHAKKEHPKLKMFFGEKYGDKVRVVEVKDFTWELCGGTHVKNTKDIQLFKIISEASIASGIRRIEAVTGEGLNQHIQKLISKVGEMDTQIEKLILEKEELEKQLGQFTKVEQSVRPSLGKITLTDTINGKVIDQVERAIQERETVIENVSNSTIDLKKQLSKYRIKEVSLGIETLIERAQILEGIKIVSGKVDVQSVDELQSLGDTLRSKLGSGVGVLSAVMNEKVSLVCVVTDDLIKNKKLQAGKIVGEIAKLVGGGGGGRPHLATAGGKDVAKLDEALKEVVMIVKNLLI